MPEGLKRGSTWRERALRLSKLAEFLLVFHAEAPCDWLVWIFIDAVSTQPVTALIPQVSSSSWP